MVKDKKDDKKDKKDIKDEKKNKKANSNSITNKNTIIEKKEKKTEEIKEDTQIIIHDKSNSPTDVNIDIEENEIIDNELENNIKKNKAFNGVQLILFTKKMLENYEDNKDNYDADYEDDYNPDYEEDRPSREKEAVDRKRKVKDFEKINVNYVNYNRDEKYYFENLTLKKRKFFGSIEKLTNKINDVTTPLRFKILDLKIEDKYKAIALKKIEGMTGQDNDTYKRKNWIEQFCKIPFGKYKSLEVSSSNSKEKITSFLKNTKTVLDKKVYGNTFAKDQFLRILAQWISNPSSKGNVIGLCGSPGTGKTVFVKDGVCNALKLPFAFIPLGGMNDGAYLTGHSYCYEGSTPGLLTNELIKANYMNPIIYFDELDKVATSNKGQEIINTLIHLTDPSQNDKFKDKYFSEIDFDLSKALIVFTYNDESLINPVLKDRIIKINIDKYDSTDKVLIIKNYIYPDMLTQFNLKPTEIILTDEAIKYLISKTEKEDGVRNLKRNVEVLLSTINLLKITNDNEVFNSQKIKIELPFTITNSIIDKIIRSNKNSNASFHHLYT